jgi:transcription initiation factor TFIID/TFIIF subunit
MYTTEKAKITIFHDLNFQSPEYKNDQTIVFKNPSQALIQALRETGPVGNDDDTKATKARKLADGKKRKFAFDYEKMGDALTKLNEDDLLHVIQMIHDHKNDDTVTNNDLERGEFTVDLFTMPEPLTKMIWDFLVRTDSFCSILPSICSWPASHLVRICANYLAYSWSRRWSQHSRQPGTARLILII